MFTIGVDIGGMSVKVGLVDDNGKIVSQSRVKTANTPEKVIANMVDQINAIFNEQNISVKDIRGIGIGCPGAVTSATGMVEFLPNLGWEKVPLSDMLKKSFDTDVKISNYANVAAL